METDRYTEFCTRFFESLYRHRKSDTAVIQILSNLYASSGKRKDSFRMDKRYARLVPLNPIAHYNLACDYALVKRTPEAIKSLKTAITLGYDDMQWIRDDVDLDPIRNEISFQNLIANYRPKISSK